MYYPVTIPWFVRKVLYPGYLWSVPGADKVMYLTFDDGPHPEATPFVLDTLKRFGAKGTFFCIGKNVVEQPALYSRILQEGHAVGNHTQHHVNGWKTAEGAYVKDVMLAGQHIDTKLYRPPYGKITRQQAGAVKQLGLTVVMWSVLSGDFDARLTPEACLGHVVKHGRAGSVVVFHDSAKAFNRMGYALPRVLDYFGGQGYRFEKITVPAG